MSEARFEESYGEFQVWATPDGMRANVRRGGIILKRWFGETAYMDAARWACDEHDMSTYSFAEARARGW